MSTWHSKSLPSLRDMTLDDMQKGLGDGEFTSEDLVRTYLKRVEEVNHIVRAITELDPSALEESKILDEERGRGNVRGYL